MRTRRQLFSEWTIVVTMLSALTGIISCQHQAENLNTFPGICFQSKILPIFLSNCAMGGCHSGDNESGYDFTSYKGIREGIVPGKPLKSPVYNSIIAYWGESAMPPSQPLSEENRVLIRLWIEQGGQNVATCSDTPGPVDSWRRARSRRWSRSRGS